MKYKSDIMETIHENALENFKIGAISEAKMREYDKLCLVKEKKETYKTESAETDTISPAIV